MPPQLRNPAQDMYAAANLGMFYDPSKSPEEQADVVAAIDAARAGNFANNEVLPSGLTLQETWDHISGLGGLAGVTAGTPGSPPVMFYNSGPGEWLGEATSPYAPQMSSAGYLPWNPAPAPTWPPPGTVPSNNGEIATVPGSQPNPPVPSGGKQTPPQRPIEDWRRDPIGAGRGTVPPPTGPNENPNAPVPVGQVDPATGLIQGAPFPGPVPIGNIGGGFGTPGGFGPVPVGQVDPATGLIQGAPNAPTPGPGNIGGDFGQPNTFPAGTVPSNNGEIATVPGSQPNPPATDLPAFAPASASHNLQAAMGQPGGLAALANAESAKPPAENPNSRGNSSATQFQGSPYTSPLATSDQSVTSVNGRTSGNVRRRTETFKSGLSGLVGIG